MEMGGPNLLGVEDLFVSGYGERKSLPHIAASFYLELIHHHHLPPRPGYFAMTSQHTRTECGVLAQLTPELQKPELDTLIAAQPAPVRGRYELLPAIQKQKYGYAEDVEKLMTIMHEARTNVFPRGHQNLRKSRQPYEIVLRLIAGIEEAPAPPDGTRSAYLDLSDPRCYRQSLYKLLQILRDSEALGDYGNAKLFVPFLQILATDLLNVQTTSEDGNNELQ